MSTEGGEGKSSKKAASQRSSPTEQTAAPAPSIHPEFISQQLPQLPKTPPKLTEEQTDVSTTSAAVARHPQAKRDQPSESTTPSTPEDPAKPRQVIAVSASKGPAAFFNLARKFLVTDEMCDLSALEGAIVSAVDAAHLLERSKLATIVRVQTSYVAVEPKRRKSQQATPTSGTSPVVEAASPSAQQQQLMQHGEPITLPAAPVGRGGRQSGGGGSGGGGGRERELRRARIVITVKRTESYKQWLEENPLQAIIAGDGGDDDEGATGEESGEVHHR